jgi:hypothetical protein
VPIRSATGYSSWRFLQPAVPNGPHGVPAQQPPPFAAGDAVLVAFRAVEWPQARKPAPPGGQGRRGGPLIHITEAPAVVLSCQPGPVPVVHVRFTAGGLAGSTAGIPLARVRKAP